MEKEVEERKKRECELSFTKSDGPLGIFRV